MNLSKLTGQILSSETASRAISGYRFRQSQAEMADSVSDLIELGGISVLEAGTGVGKSFAYLIPAVLSEQRTVVSTATITLQDQLLCKDIPAVGLMTGRTVDAAVLKGRSNYVCLRKWSLWGRIAAQDLEELASGEDGDISASSSAAGASGVHRIRADSLDCLGNRCPLMQSCFYYKARKKAMAARIIIVNHHLLLSGLETGEIIPDAWFLAADEAHWLNRAASATMGHSLSVSMLKGVFDAVSLSALPHLEKAALLQEAASLSGAVGALLADALESFAATETRMEALADAAGVLAATMTGEDELAGAAQILSSVKKSCLSAITVLHSPKWCSYIEKSAGEPVLRTVPVEPGPLLREILYSAFPAVLLTSATLSAGDSFSYADSLLGVPPEAERRIFSSPFDYAKQAVMAIPENLPPHDDHQAVAASAWHHAGLSARILGGRTMALFTSYRNLELCRIEAESNPVEGIRLLVQGDMSNSALLRSYRADPAAVILGTSSFWEGVDLPGRLLGALVIDRIPFPSPGHPLMEARLRLAEEEGRSSFRDVMLPEAAMRLKQGAGRLIRSSEDRGVVFFLDRRLKTAGYSSFITSSLPGFQRASVEDALQFLWEQNSPVMNKGVEGRQL